MGSILDFMIAKLLFIFVVNMLAKGYNNYNRNVKRQYCYERDA